MKAPINLKRVAKQNPSFSRVLDTGKFGQLVTMTLHKGEDIGEEIHATTDQFIYIVEGKGEFRLDGLTYPVEEHSAMFVPAGARHDVINTGKDEMKLISVYSPPLHPEKEIIEQRVKATLGTKH